MRAGFYFSPPLTTTCPFLSLSLSYPFSLVSFLLFLLLLLQWGAYINRIGSLCGFFVVILLIVYVAATQPELFYSDGAIYG